MENTFLLGRILLFCAMGFFGIQHFLHSTSIAAPLLGPPWVLAVRFFALIVGAALLVACASVEEPAHAALYSTNPGRTGEKFAATIRIEGFSDPG